MDYNNLVYYFVSKKGDSIGFNHFKSPVGLIADTKMIEQSWRQQNTNK